MVVYVYFRSRFVRVRVRRVSVASSYIGFFQKDLRRSNLHIRLVAVVSIPNNGNCIHRGHKTELILIFTQRGHDRLEQKRKYGVWYCFYIYVPIKCICFCSPHNDSDGNIFVGPVWVFWM